MDQRSINLVGGGGLNSHNIFERIISLENLFLAWKEFKKGKTNNRDIQKFSLYLEDNIFQLHEELKAYSYMHGAYTSFFVADPKLRHIHKASVRDRLLHHAVFRILYSIFDSGFIYDSYSCRMEKGTHRAVNRLERFIAKFSRNNSRLVYVLKCDIRKFFDSIDQGILARLIDKKIKDEDARRLLGQIIGSFSKTSDRGLPLGNVTSQLFANIYLNEFDQFVKQALRVKYYLRYCDDFIILGENRENLILILKKVSNFLSENLKLLLHTNKITISKHRQGIDFLGYVTLLHHRVLRTKTKRRIFIKMRQKIEEYKLELITRVTLEQSLQSYLGVLSYANCYKLAEKLKNKFLFWLTE